MSSDFSLFNLPSETDVLPASPLFGPAACTASLCSPSTESSVRSRTMNCDTPLPASILRILSNIDAIPSPPCSSLTVSTEPLACAPPLTERVLRSQRRHALRALHDVVVTSSPTTVRPHDTLDESEIRTRISNSCIRYSTPQRLTSVYYSTFAPRPDACS